MIAAKVLLPLSLLSPGVGGDADLQQTKSGDIVWRLPEGIEEATLNFDLDAMQIRPRDYDEIHLRFKPRGGEILWQPELTAYPVKGLRRHWYSKFPLQQNEWQTARFDLNRDDDGWWVGGKSDLEHHALNVELTKQWQRVPGEENWREVEIGSIAFVRRVVGVDFDEMAARPIDSKTEIGWTYNLIVTNNDTEPHAAKLRLDTSRQKYFSADWKNKTVTLKPRERRIIPVQLSLSKTAAKKLPPLYSEPVQAFIALDEKDATEFTPLRGYRPRYLWATLPPAKYEFPSVMDFAKMVAQAEKVLLEDWGVPTYGPATHPQGYYNPATSKTPIPLSWFRHQDPQTGEIFTDDKYVLSYILTIHKNNFNRAEILADAYRATGDLRFASAAAKVLLEYARQYPFMRPSAPDATSGRSRLGLNTLMSSYIFPQICDAYAKIKNSAALGDGDRAAIETHFLIPETVAIYDHDIGYSNMQAEHYLAYMHAAFALNYWPLAGEAIYGDHGFYAMVEHAFSEDGISHEAGAYHWSTLSAMLNFAKFLDARGVNVMNTRFKRVFDGMVNNSPQGIYEQAGTWSAFDFAYRVYREPKYIPTLKAAKLWPPSYERNVILKGATRPEESPKVSNGVSHRGDPSTSLVPRSAQDDDGIKAESKIGERLTESSVLPNVGYLWLREQSSRGFRSLSINYISQWDRGEHDRLHFSLFDEHGRVTSEIGRIIYSAPEAVTMESTFAHNTVVVDGKNQEFQPSTLEAFLDRSSLSAALITENPHSPLYPGIEFSRVVAILDGVFFIGDLYHGKGEHTFDWPFYAPWQPGDNEEIAAPRTTLKLENVAEPKSTFSEYPWISKAQSAKTDESISVALRVEEAESRNPRNLQITFAPMQNALFVSALVPRGYRPKPGPMFFVRRQKTSTAQFGAAFDIVAPDEKNCIQKVENIPITEKAAAWRVQMANGKYLIVINRSGGAVRADDFETKETLYVARMQ
jgi:hypothetical protein